MQFAWDILETMLKGQSGLDLKQVPFDSLEEAASFLSQYGFNWTNPDEQEQILLIQSKAIDFIENRFLQSHTSWDHFWSNTERFKVPREFKHMDTPMLLLMASRKNNHLLHQAWACAILKMMHLICHTEHSFYANYVEEAQQQILPRFQSLLFCHAKTKQLCMGEPNGVFIPIIDFQIKDPKSTASVITKLICKKESIAEQVLDLIGYRIITETPADAILVIEILRHHRALIFANLVASRSRNGLVDFDAFQKLVNSLKEEPQQNDFDIDKLRTVATAYLDKRFNTENTSSHSNYRAIHLTGRQLITVMGDGKPMCIFFPFELQVVDRQSHINNHLGESAHNQYKRKQFIRARRRILAPLLMLHRQREKLKRC